VSDGERVRRRLGHSAVLLAGGGSSRFGSDKLLAPLGGAPLLVHAVRNALALFQEVVVVAKEPEKYRGPLVAAGFSAQLDSSLQLRSDLSPRTTPLAGLEAGLAAARGESCFVAGADMPFAANPKLLEALGTALQNRDAAAPRFAGAPQPLCALLRREPSLAAASALLERASAGPLALLQAIDTAWIEYASIDPADARGVPFLDEDTPAALLELELELELELLRRD
jgi:molybdopterin-guanine dinucleotide biosynthesis protein A